MTKNKVQSFASALILFFFAYQGPANAVSQNYCPLSDGGVRIYFAPQKGASEIELNANKASLNSLANSLEIGQQIEILFVTEAGIINAFSECRPGCPEQSIWAEIFGGGNCKPTLAKRDRLSFANKLKATLQKIIIDSQGGLSGYEAIMPTLAAVQAHEKLNNGNLDNVLVSSMYVGASADKKALNNFFVRAVQTTDNQFSFPSMGVTGMPINADLIKLWKDLYKLNGQEFEYK
jgi:hypothetical protein